MERAQPRDRICRKSLQIAPSLKGEDHLLIPCFTPALKAHWVEKLFIGQHKEKNHA